MIIFIFVIPKIFWLHQDPCPLVDTFREHLHCSDWLTQSYILACIFSRGNRVFSCPTCTVHCGITSYGPNLLTYNVKKCICSSHIGIYRACGVSTNSIHPEATTNVRDSFNYSTIPVRLKNTRQTKSMMSRHTAS